MATVPSERFCLILTEAVIAYKVWRVREFVEVRRVVYAEIFTFEIFFLTKFIYNLQRIIDQACILISSQVILHVHESFVVVIELHH
jgi:hypothetical protein